MEQKQTDSSSLARRRHDPTRYERIKLIVSGINFTLYIVVPLLFLITEGSAWARDTIVSWGIENVVLGAVVYGLIAALIMSVITLPLDFFSGHLLERRYGLSKRGSVGWSVDWLKGMGLQLMFIGGFVAATYALIAAEPELWWIWASVIFTALTVFIAAIAPVVFFPIFFKFEPLPDGELKDRLMRLSYRLGTYVQGAYIWKLGEKTVKANAALAGWGKTRRIIISDTLLEKHTDDEIEVVIAHELGHHVNNDIWRGIAVQTVLIFISMWAVNIALNAFSSAFGFSGEIDDFANLPLLGIVISVVTLIALPIANTYSRHRESAADDFAIRITGMRDEFVSAMQKLADQNFANRQPHWLIETAFHSHPSIARRVERARDG